MLAVEALRALANQSLLSLLHLLRAVLLPAQRLKITWPIIYATVSSDEMRAIPADDQNSLRLLKLRSSWNLSASKQKTLRLKAACRSVLAVQEVHARGVQNGGDELPTVQGNPAVFYMFRQAPAERQPDL